jgi:hypothetical protein
LIVIVGLFGLLRIMEARTLALFVDGGIQMHIRNSVKAILISENKISLTKNKDDEGYVNIKIKGGMLVIFTNIFTNIKKLPNFYLLSNLFDAFSI